MAEQRQWRRVLGRVGTGVRVPRRNNKPPPIAQRLSSSCPFSVSLRCSRTRIPQFISLRRFPLPLAFLPLDSFSLIDRFSLFHRVETQHNKIWACSSSRDDVGFLVSPFFFYYLSLNPQTTRTVASRSPIPLSPSSFTPIIPSPQFFLLPLSRGLSPTHPHTRQFITLITSRHSFRFRQRGGAPRVRCTLHNNKKRFATPSYQCSCCLQRCARGPPKHVNPTLVDPYRWLEAATCGDNDADFYVLYTQFFSLSKIAVDTRSYTTVQRTPSGK